MFTWYRFRTKMLNDIKPFANMAADRVQWKLVAAAPDDEFVIMACRLPENSERDVSYYWPDAEGITKEEAVEIENA